MYDIRCSRTEFVAASPRLGFPQPFVGDKHAT